MEIKIVKDYKNPEERKIEIVERKGMGHPDTLADKLAEECSRVYSKYCVDNFGFILHHNIDKLYIGGGLFLLENNNIVMYNPIRIELNGRVSNEINSKKIDLEEIFIPVIKDYLSSVLPRINPEKDLNIVINPTQFSKREYWYSPRDINDVPDALELFAADTSLCVCHGCRTFCENLAFELEQSFWSYNDKGYPYPKFDDVGGDIKVMVSRLNRDVVATICMPVFKDLYNTKDQYDLIVKKHQDRLYNLVSSIEGNKNYNVKIEINALPDGTFRNYSLVKGSCIECGEEGVVGRGNSAQGLISSFREHTVEAPCGKNERYHTGRVLNFMANKAVKRIYEELGVKSTIYCLTRNRGSIERPYLFYLSVNDTSKNKEINKIINEEFNENFVQEIIKSSKLV